MKHLQCGPLILSALKSVKKILKLRTSNNYPAQQLKLFWLFIQQLGAGGHTTCYGNTGWSSDNTGWSSDSDNTGWSADNTGWSSDSDNTGWSADNTGWSSDSIIQGDQLILIQGERRILYKLVFSWWDLILCSDGMNDITFILEPNSVQAKRH